MGVEELLVFDIREWADLRLWIAERYISVYDMLNHEPMTTIRVYPEEWVAPIHYNRRTDAAVRHCGKVVYHMKEYYGGEMNGTNGEEKD